MRKNNVRTTEKKQRRRMKSKAKRARRVADRNARVDAQVRRLTRTLERRDRVQKSFIKALQVGIQKLRAEQAKKPSQN